MNNLMNCPIWNPVIDNKLQTNISLETITQQCIVLLIFNDNTVRHYTVHNYIVSNLSSVTQNNGLYIGIGRAVDTSVKMGTKWSSDEMCLIFLFDSMDYGQHFLEEVHLHNQFLGQIDALIIPLFTTIRSPHTFRYLEVALFDVKYPREFGDHVKQLPDLASKNYGQLVSASQYLQVHCGKRVPTYAILSQWETESNFKDYLDAEKNLLNGNHYACETRTLLHLDLSSIRVC